MADEPEKQKKSNPIKNSYAILIIIVGVILAILGAIALIDVAKNPPVEQQLNDCTTMSIGDQMRYAHGEYNCNNNSTTSNPWTYPIVEFGAGLVCIAFGAANIVINRRSLSQTTP